MNSAGVTVSDSPTPGNLFDEFEEAFQNCLAPLTKEDPLNGINQEELIVNAETNGQRFLELAHRMDAAFLQKRLLLLVQKPELLLMEENHEMRIEISRKDELIKKQTEKVADWQNTLTNLVNWLGSTPSHVGPRAPAAVGGPSQGALPPAHMMGAGVGVGAPHGIGHQSLAGQQVSGGGAGATSMGPGGYAPMGGGGAAGAPLHGPAMFHGSPMGQGGLQGPLAYLEKTTTNIGMPEARR